MDINRIRYFHVVAQTKHIRGAADFLGLNAGSLSKAIKTLEDELGFSLIQQSGRRIEITRRGLNFYNQSRRLLDEYDSLKLSLKNTDSNENNQKLVIGSFEVFTSYCMASLITKEFSNDRILLQELTPGKIEEALANNVIDYGFTYFPIPNENLDFLKVSEFTMKVFGRKEYQKISFEDLPFAVPITAVDSPAILFKSLDGWPVEKFQRKVKYEFELLETALQTSRLGHSVLYCPDFIVSLHNRYVNPEFCLFEIPLPKAFKPLRYSIYLVKRKSDPEDLKIKKIAKFFRSLVKN